jgi:hypothetical protein
MMLPQSLDFAPTGCFRFYLCKIQIWFEDVCTGKDWPGLQGSAACNTTVRMMGISLPGF